MHDKTVISDAVRALFLSIRGFSYPTDGGGVALMKKYIAVFEECDIPNEEVERLSSMFEHWATMPKPHDFRREWAMLSGDITKLSEEDRQSISKPRHKPGGKVPKWFIGYMKLMDKRRLGQIGTREFYDGWIKILKDVGAPTDEAEKQRDAALKDEHDKEVAVDKSRQEHRELQATERELAEHSNKRDAGSSFGLEHGSGSTGDGRESKEKAGDTQG